MTKKWLILTPILFFTGCLATYPIEEKRMSTYCHNIELGSDILNALGTANQMFGVKVKTIQTESTICFLKSSEGRVIERYFSGD